ncbi:MAG: hypothetical protein LBQ44_01085 [Treponema sp.]|jgi:hypothetical protein|nr:hypothetical protein [Treponema sp.]
MVQVKTTDNKKADWLCPMPESPNKNLVYIFVRLAAETSCAPLFHIVPAKDVIKVINAIDAGYIENRRRQGKKPFNADGNKRGVSHFRDFDEKYRDRWDLLGFKG